MNYKYNILEFSFAIFISTLFILFSENNTHQFLTLFLVLLVSFFFINNRDKKLFYYFFFLSFLFSRIIALELIFENGTFFTNGQDDEFFNNAAQALFDSNFDLVQPYFILAPYKLFILFLGFWIKILNFLSFGFASSDSYHYSFLIINNFIGSFSVIYLRKIIYKLNIIKDLKGYKLYFILFSPIVIYYSSVLLREIWIIMFFVIGMYFLISKNLKNNFIKLSAISIALFFIRPFNAAVFLLMVFSWQFLSIRNVFTKSIILFIFPLTILYFIFSIDSFFVFSLLNSMENMNNFILDNVSENSIGKILFQSNSIIIVYLIRPLYILISPFPPPFFTDYSIISFLKSFNGLVWVVTLPFYFLFLLNFLKKSTFYKKNNYDLYKYVLVVSLLMLVNTLAINFFTGNPRHNSFIYILVYPFLIYFISKEKVFFKKNLIYFFFSIAILILATFIYLFLKVL